MAKRELYSDHLDTLIALVQHLAMTEHRSRKPSSLAAHLSLEDDEVLLVLENFKGLFRKSKEPDEQGEEHFYTLQLRYARRWLGEHDDQSIEPLKAEYLSSLLSFVARMVEQEEASKRQSSANKIATGAAILAAVAVIISAYIGYVGFQISQTIRMSP